RKIMEQLPKRHSFRNRVSVSIVAWDDAASGTAMKGELTPQAALKEGLPVPSECDIVIVLFWSRLGTPFTDSDGKRYESGTHWELLDALNSSCTDTYIYRRTEPPDLGQINAPTHDEDLIQYRRLQKFLNDEPFYRGDEIQKSVRDYETPSDFEEMFDFQFEVMINRVLQKDAQDILDGSHTRSLPDPMHAARFDDLKREYYKLRKQLSVELERLEEKQNEYEGLKILYIQQFSKYLLDQKELEMQKEILLKTIQVLQLISTNRVHYIVLSENSQELPESHSFTDNLTNSLRHKSCNYEFICDGKSLHIKALLSEEIPVSKYSFASDILSSTIHNGNTLIIKTETDVSVFEIGFRKFQLEEINYLMKSSEPRRKYDQEKKKIHDLKSVKVDTPGLEKREIKEMKSIYREIMKYTHVDIYGGKYPNDWDDEKVKVYDDPRK
ncbi:MAG: hypothetical protein KAS23_11990, partial [Anaerohalosphaera sp.]|nr:hypothetical protein [Anaerohalosphaera sp.]